MVRMIPLYLENGVAYVWNSDDWYNLRSQQRICGSLIGSITSHPRQNDFQGLPWALTSEEAALLVEKNICRLFTLPKLTDKPSEAEKVENQNREQNLLEQQKEALKKKRIEQFSQKIDIIAAGKRKKLLAKGLPDSSLDREALIQEEIKKLPPLLPAHVLLHMPIEHVRDTERLCASVDELIPSIYGKGAIRFSIYKDLWNKGFYITDGLKFGVDFLVYPGDPVKFHAMYMVRCINNEATSFHPAGLVAFGRLSVAVNKLAVLAFGSQSGKIGYQTLQWHESVNG